MNFNRIAQPLDDLSPMPWGVHKGKPMQEVPASYFHFLWTRLGKRDDRSCPVADYIRRSLSDLKQENSDLIW